MNLRRKQEILRIANQRRSGISESKGPEYAGSAEKYGDDDQDVLANFKRQGSRWDLDPLVPAAIYAGKHIDSLETFIREVKRPSLSLDDKRDLAMRGEGIVSRLDDLRNYCDLLECLLVELGIVPAPFVEGTLNEILEEGFEVQADMASRDPVDVTPGLRDLGPITGADVQVAASIDGGHELAEDYNYMRERVIQLQQEVEDLVG